MDMSYQKRNLYITHAHTLVQLRVHVCVYIYVHVYKHANVYIKLY